MMRLLAIDPGPTESAYVLWDGTKLHEHDKVSNTHMLDLIRRPRCADFCVIEQVASYGMPVGAEVFETCVWTGRFMEAFEWGVDRLPRLKVKLHLCHDSRAKDGNIRQALIDRFGEPGTKKAPGMLYGVSGDVWAALAVAVTWWDQQRVPGAVQAVLRASDRSDRGESGREGER